MSLLEFRRPLASHHLNPGVAKFVTPGFSLAPIPSPTPSPVTIANPRNGLRFVECSLFRAETRRGATSRFGPRDVRPEVSGLRRDFFVRVMAREETDLRVMGLRVITRETFEIADLRVMSGQFWIGRPM